MNASAGSAAAGGVPTHSTRVVLDMDYGIDDSMATLYLTSLGTVEIVAIGTVHGNAPAVAAAANAAQVMRAAGLVVPIAIGAQRPLAQHLDIGSQVHGADGIGGMADGSTPTVSDESAAEQLVRLARANPGELTLLATGPLTNVALATMLDPELPNLLRSVVIMGGALRVSGNITPDAEANIWHDPEAADLVFASFPRVTLAPVDLTHAMVIDESHLARIEGAESTPLRDLVRGMLPQYLAFNLESTGTVGFPLHDPSAAILLAKPELAAYERVEIAVEKRGELTRGALVIDDRPYPASFGRPRVWVGRPAATSFAEEFVSVAFGA